MPEIKTLPIIFSDAMVKALLEGRKTQTRRIPTPMWDKAYQHVKEGGKLALYVREHINIDDAGNSDFEEYPLAYHVNYPADGHKEWRFCKPPRLKNIGAKPSIHMPKWASRITLEVTEIRRERLNNISEEDSGREGTYLDEDSPEETDYRNYWMCPVCFGTGLHAGFRDGGVIFDVDCRDCDTARKRFRHLWNSLHGKKTGEAWADNPEVYVLSFNVHRCNVGEFGEQGGNNG